MNEDLSEKRRHEQVRADLHRRIKYPLDDARNPDCPRNWSEDPFGGEYCLTCVECSKPFAGMKGRSSCKTCSVIAGGQALQGLRTMNPEGAPLTETWACVFYAQWPEAVSERFVLAIYSGPLDALPTVALFTPCIDRVIAYLENPSLRLQETLEREKSFWAACQAGSVSLSEWKRFQEAHEMVCIRGKRISLGIATPEWSAEAAARRIWGTAADRESRIAFCESQNAERKQDEN